MLRVTPPATRVLTGWRKGSGGEGMLSSGAVRAVMGKATIIIFVLTREPSSGESAKGFPTGCAAPIPLATMPFPIIQSHQE